MRTITVGTAFNIDLEFRTASAGKRALAVLLDMSILIAYMLVVYRFVFQALQDGMAGMNEFLRMLSISILPFLYFPLTEIMMNGQTPGKKFTGIRVMDMNGKEAGISQFLLRWLIGFGNYAVFLLPYLIASTAFGLPGALYSGLLITGAFYFPDFICSLISVKGQRIADLAAGTVVIDVRRKTNISETIYLELDDTETAARFPQVMQLSDKDINKIQQLVKDKANGRADIAYKARIAARIKEALQLETDMNDQDFLSQLIRDYNYLTQRGSGTAK